MVDVPVTAPTPGLIVSAGEPVTTQFSVLDWPAPIVAGIAAKLAIAGAGPTVTIVAAVAVPNEFVAVSR
jgi:hypothetical protein